MTVENSAKLHILIIDDEALIRWSVGETLAHAGYDVSEGGSAKEALQRLAAALCPTSSCSTASVDVHEV